jgi:predicted regulator of Ras-like GTPase activity (Roadblock/LC7/MglB family)
LTKHNQTINETSNSVFIEDAKVLPVEEDLDFTNLNATLTEIRKTQGVIGYILRNKTLATVNFAESDKIFDYALLTSQTIDHADSLAQLFNVGKVESMLLEGKNVKTLCIVMCGIQISVFMEKATNHSEILEKLLSSRLLKEKEFY